MKFIRNPRNLLILAAIFLGLYILIKPQLPLILDAWDILQGKGAIGEMQETINWKTFTSKFSGLTFKYPPNWSLQSYVDSLPSESFNGINGSDESIQLQSIKTQFKERRLYLCISITSGSQVPSEPQSIQRDNFTISNGQKMSINTYGDQSISNSRMKLVRQDGSPLEINGRKYMIYALFNCDNYSKEVLTAAKDSFDTREEVKDVKLIFRSINY